ncbi:hypothetical protein GCM10023205_34650 [Yinghuangia aomiensis]|uniref:Alpha-1,2-mannosyltransferase n=1 Tax=Yinghuangia aomiensis TaxID=676205 RepID=A0ABP9HC91_9ACTN
MVWRPYAARISGVAAVLCFLAAAVWSWWSAWHLPSWDRQMDLHVYRGAVLAVRDGHPLYKYVAENGDPFTYPPFAAVVMWPLGWVSEPVARVLWTGATLAAVVGIAATLLARRGIEGRRRYTALTLVGASVLLLSAPVQSNLRFGQISVFLVLLAFLDVLDALPRPLRGVLVGIAAAIKLTPMLFIPYLWATGRRRDAVRASAAFAACTGLAHALWPADSTTFWTSAVFSTSRIGNLAASGNQSINGALIRTGVVPPERAVAWLLLSALICVIALVGACHSYRTGRAVQGAVIVGCATVAASPVSWTHHQVWLVLAGLLLVAGPGKARVGSGAALLIGMTISVGGWLPGGFVADNVRLLAALGVCAWGLAPLWHRGTVTAHVLPGVRVLLRPRTVMAYAAVAAVAAGVVVAVVREAPVTVRVRTAGDRDTALWGAGTDECATFAQAPLPGGRPGTTLACESAVDPVGGRQLNFGAGTAADGTVTIQGQVGPEVARLVFVTVEGTRAIEVPLIPAPGPTGGPIRLPGNAAVPRMGPAPFPGGPIEDHRINGARNFGIAVSNTSHALLLAYGPDGRLIAEGGDKLRYG